MYRVTKMVREDLWKQYARKGTLYPKHVEFLKREIRRKMKLMDKLTGEIIEINEILSLNNKNNSDMLDKSNKL